MVALFSDINFDGYRTPKSFFLLFDSTVAMPGRCPWAHSLSMVSCSGPTVHLLFPSSFLFPTSGCDPSYFGPGRHPRAPNRSVFWAVSKTLPLSYPVEGFLTQPGTRDLTPFPLVPLSLVGFLIFRLPGYSPPRLLRHSFYVIFFESIAALASLGSCLPL